MSQQPAPINTRFSADTIERLDQIVPKLGGFKPSRSDAIREAVAIGLPILEQRMETTARHIADALDSTKAGSTEAPIKPHALPIPPLGAKPRAQRKPKISTGWQKRTKSKPTKKGKRR